MSIGKVAAMAALTIIAGVAVFALLNSHYYREYSKDTMMCWMKLNERDGGVSHDWWGLRACLHSKGWSDAALSFVGFSEETTQRLSDMDSGR